MSIASSKKLRRDICRTMGHEWIDLVVQSVSRGNVQCSRCKKKVWSAWGARVGVPTFEVDARPKVKYSDLQTKRFSPLDRAKDRASNGDKT